MGVPRIVIATANRGKAREIAALYGDLPITWLAMHELGTPPDVLEDGASFSENATLKARAIAEWSGLPALADDSGLEADALGGAPGVRSARFAGPDATDAENVALLLEWLADTPTELRTARFRAVMVLWQPDGAVDEAEGTCEGHIGVCPRGESGFGYDPVFVPTGWTSTFAELGPEVKNSISHRAVALRRLRPALTRIA